MKKILPILLLFHSLLCFSQNDTINRRGNYYTKRTNLGINYDFKNSNIGFSISNGVDLEPLIHFEDFTKYFRYKIEFDTNFQKNWNLNSYFGYHFPRRFFIKEIGLENKYYDYKNNFKLLNYGIVGKKFIGFLQSELILKLNYQKLNNYKNIGFEFGAQKSLIYKKLFTEFGVGFNSNYFSYYAMLQSLIYKDQFGINIGFESIDNYNFAKIGINYQIINTGYH